MCMYNRAKFEKSAETVKCGGCGRSFKAYTQIHERTERSKKTGSVKEKRYEFDYYRHFYDDCEEAKAKNLYSQCEHCPYRSTDIGRHMKSEHAEIPLINVMRSE